MAVNRFMKPANQPLLDTHVPLPFKEMSLAYATKQKEHNDAEELAASLDDEILKIKASSPEHAHYLTQYRQGLTTELSDLYDKHEGRYADMVPVLKKIKNRTDLEILQGNLGIIKKSTKQTEKLQKKISVAKESGEYDDDFNPVLATEGNWQNWFRTGTTGSNDDGSWNLTEDSQGIYGTEGRLKSFSYTGLHPHVDELKEANENVFKYVKPDIEKLVREYESGAKTTLETKRVTLSKLYNAAHKNKSYLSDGFKNELDYVVGTRMDDDQVISAATNAINNMIGSEEGIQGMYGSKPNDEQKAHIAKMLEERSKAIASLTQDQNGDAVPVSSMAYDLAKTNYIGAMGEKFMMSDVVDELTWDQSALERKRKKGRTPATDWVPVIAGTTPVVSYAKPYTIKDPSTSVQESDQPLANFNDIVVDRKTTYENALKEYELLKTQGTMDDEMHQSKQDEIARLKYQYQAAAFSQKNLIQTTALGMNMRRIKNHTPNQPDLIEYVVNGERKTVSVNSPMFRNGGFNVVEFDENGLPTNMGAWDGQKSLTQEHLGYDYSQGFLAYLNNPQGDLNKALNSNVQNFGANGWYGGRSAKLPTWNTSMSKSLDTDVRGAMQSNFIKDDFKFQTNEGTSVSLSELLDNKIIKDEVVEEFIIDDDLPIVWTTVPDPSTGNYRGMISVPTDGSEAGDRATMTLYFDAPAELKQSWLSLTEDYDDQGLKYTRATTPVEKMVFNNNFNAQMDIQSAATINGDVAPSMYHDGDGRVLGMYYFNQTPDGDPIVNSEFLFRPQAGLVASINPDGSYQYTTGDELYPTDIEASQLSQLIALNDPQYSGSLEFWKKHMSESMPTGNYPIAIQNAPVPERSEAREVDVTGMPYSTTLATGQTSYSGDRVQQNMLWGTTNHGLLGTNIKFANQVGSAEMEYSDKSDDVVNSIANDFETTYKDVPVTLTDGSTTNLLAAVTNGDISLQWVTSDGTNRATIPINNSNRTYQEQLNKYTKWVDGGKKGDPIADPNVGGFHVMGQAIDLSQTKGKYDLILVTSDNISSIGNNRSSNVNTKNTGNGNVDKTNGIRVSELKSDGKLLYPNFLKNRLTEIFNSLSSQTGGDDNRFGGAPIRQFDAEWWHWSAGEFTTETPAVYPSW